MTGPEFALLFAAGIGAGLSGSIAGLASLFSFPALLAVGLPPLTANVTNTVALVFSSVGSVLGSRPELRQQNNSRLVRFAAVAVLGGAAGSTLLLLTPASAFDRIVPVLIGLASVAVLLPRPHTDPEHPHPEPRWLLPVVFGIGIYGGYFGAAAGTLLLAMFLLATSDTLARCNAVKNLILGIANGVAAVLFAIIAHIDWVTVPPLAAGLLLGGLIGPSVVRRVPVRPLRWVIALAGIGLAIHLGLQDY